MWIFNSLNIYPVQIIPSWSLRINMNILDGSLKASLNFAPICFPKFIFHGRYWIIMLYKNLLLINPQAIKSCISTWQSRMRLRVGWVGGRGGWGVVVYITLESLASNTTWAVLGCAAWIPWGSEEPRGILVTTSAHCDPLRVI